MHFSDPLKVLVIRRKSLTVPRNMLFLPLTSVVEQVSVYDYIWTTDDPLSGSVMPSDESHREGAPLPEGETSTHVIIYTLYLSGLKQRYRHFLRQPDGAIIEVR